MNTIEIPDRNLTIQTPEHWDECTSNQVHRVLRYCLQASDGLASELAARIRIFYDLANVKRTWRSVFLERIMPDEWLELKYANTARVVNDLTQFAFREVDGQIEINFDTVMQHFPQIRVRRFFRTKTFVGVGHQLSDCTFGAFRAALEELEEYFSMRAGTASAAELEHQLSRFMACIYYPSGQCFSRDQIAESAKWLSHADRTVRSATLMWFTYCVNHIQQEPIVIAGEEISLKRLFSKPKSGSAAKRRSSAFVWIDVLYHLSKEGPFGKVDATDAAGLYDVLLCMYNQDIENRKLKNK